MNTQFNTNNDFSSVLYSNIDFRPFTYNLKGLIFVNNFDLLRNISFKNNFLKMATICGRNMWEATLIII